MGTCFCKQQQQQQQHLQEEEVDAANERLIGSTSAQVGGLFVVPGIADVKKQAGLELGNKSDYRVSYWVLQEDKVKATAIHERVLKTIEGSLNANLGVNHCVTGGTGFTARREAEIMRHLEEVPYFLMRDHRIEPPAAGITVGSTRTEVPFPKGSTDMRVYAFFQRKEDKKWVRYKDKVYSIGRGKKVYTLDATNVGIAPYL